MLLLTLFKTPPFSLKCLFHSLKSAVQTGRAAGHAPQRDIIEKSTQSFGYLQSEYYTRAIIPHWSRGANMA